MPPLARYLLQIAVLAAAYFGCAKAGLAFAFTNQSVTSIWPPTGLALAAVLLAGYRVWPGIAIGAFLANVTTAGSLLAVAGIATGNTLEALAGAYLLRHFADFRPSLERVRDVVSLAFYGAAVSTTVSATIGVASLAADGLVPAGETLSTWRVWWLGDMGGDLLFAPALLVLASKPRLPSWPWLRVEALAALILLVGVTVTSFATGELVIYLLFPILFWVAIRFRQPGIVIAGLLASSAAIWFTARGNGPFIGGSDDAELLRSQLFVGVATVTGLVVAALATERSRVLEQLHFLAGHDSLTGLVNRRRFAEELDRWLSFRDRYGGGGAVLVIDVDHFKEVNDTLGHSVGDEMLATVAKLLRNRLRKSDVIARLGGDEFVVLLPTADEDDALKVAEDLRQTVHDYGPVVSSARTVGVTVTIGVGPLQSGDIDADAVVRRADAAMYEGKHAGRDRVLLELAPVAAPPPV